MKKFLALALALVMILALAACGGNDSGNNSSANNNDTSGAGEPAGTPSTPSTPEPEDVDYSGYTIRIYSNSNSTERATWLVNAAKAEGFNISLDDNSVISGDTAAIQAANENKDGDILFGLNETRWSQVVSGA